MDLSTRGSASNSLSLKAWEALPRVDKSIPFDFQPGKWYTMKLTVARAGAKTLIKGKAWLRDQKEPAAWSIELDDPRPITEGAAGLYGYVTGIQEPSPGNVVPGNNVYYDNLSITPNQKAAPAPQAAARPASTHEAASDGRL